MPPERVPHNVDRNTHFFTLSPMGRGQGEGAGLA